MFWVGIPQIGTYGLMVWVGIPLGLRTLFGYLGRAPFALTGSTRKAGGQKLLKAQVLGFGV